MNRNKWTVDLSADYLYDAAVSQLAFATDKLAAWEAERDRHEQGLRERGITFSDTQAVSNSSYNQPQALFDPQLLSLFNEAKAKVEKWRALKEDYKAWIALISLSRDQIKVPVSFTLDKDDVVYFGLD